MTFVVDNNLSPQLAHGMKAFGEEVVHLTDQFEADAKDPEWLPWVGEGGHVLISRDEQVRWKPEELRLLRQHKVGTFFLGGKNRTRWELVQQLVRNWPRIKDLAATESRPFIFRIPPSGTKFTRIPL